MFGGLGPRLHVAAKWDGSLLCGAMCVRGVCRHGRESFDSDGSTACCGSVAASPSGGAVGASSPIAIAASTKASQASLPPTIAKKASIAAMQGSQLEARATTA